MQRIDHPLLTASLGQHKTLTSLHFGTPGASPKVYIQASLHAEELPGMLAAHHLRQRLAAAEAQGELRGEVVLVPVANPIGLAQRLDHKPMGRFELGSSENFNRHYPVLAEAVFEQVQNRLTDDAQTNVTIVRGAVGAYLNGWQPETELQSLRRTLLLLAHDADIVLDLHCDTEAVMHFYTEEACWPTLEPLARLLQCEAVLLAKDSGGSPFDECLSGLWWQLAERLRFANIHAPLPQAGASTTIELRGEADVRHGHAESDAQAIMAYLAHLGLWHTQEAPTIPQPRCQATPLSGSQTLTSRVPGVLVFLREPGASVGVGDTVAEVIDPINGTVHAVCSDVDGVFYARVCERYVLSGGEIGKVAGARPFRTGSLLGF